MVGTEIDFVVKDSLKALEFYEKIFEIERVEVTNFPKGQNEAVFSLYGVRFHMLDENPPFGLEAPEPDKPNSLWFSITVEDIEKTFSTAISLGCKEFQPITEMPEYEASNAIFIDSFGYIWMLNQVHKELSFEERRRRWEEKMGS